jgi:hypothetical protein
LPLHIKIGIVKVFLRLWIEMTMGLPTWNRNLGGSARPESTKLHLWAPKLGKSWDTARLMKF